MYIHTDTSICTFMCVRVCVRSRYLTAISTRKGSKAYLSSSERCLTLYLIRHRPYDEKHKF